jgi:serine/threonine-protein kinase
MKGTDSSATLGSPRFEEELRSYLETRLRILTRVLALLFGILSAAFVATMALGPGGSLFVALRAFTTEFPNAILFAMLAATSLFHGILGRFRLSPHGLALLDGALLWILILPCLVLYGRLHDFSFSGFAFVVPFLVVFVLARAVLIPSTALRTLLLSLPAPAGVLLIQLWHGGSFAYPAEAYPRSHFVDTLIQNQICLLGAMAVAVVASRVNLSLRRRSYDARHVGHYNLHGKIGAGAMGEVYLATHSLLKRRTAIKFLRPEIAGAAALERFEREVRLAASLTHPNTISIYDYGYTAEGVFYFAMELVEGATLREVVASGGPMPAARVIHVLAQAAGALQEAHDRGIVHRDVKPANLMLCERGGSHDFVKILDFGVAKKIEARSIVPEERTVAGSLETLAPEALRGDAGPRSDLYSLAVVAYYLVSGKPLFDVPSGSEMIHHHLATEPVPPSLHAPGLPPDLEAVILKALSKEPEDRPESAASLREALLACESAGKWTEEQARDWWAAYQPVEVPSDADSETKASSAETRIR